MLGNMLVGVLTSILVVSSNAQLCYRCFGSNWCNNFTDQNSVRNADIINCTATTKAYNYDGDNPLITRVLKNFEETSNTINNTDPVTWGCVTATVHEAHEVHTIRTCLNNAVRMCPTIRNTILNGAVNDISPKVELDCEGCIGFLCNDQTFLRLEETTATTTTIPSQTSATIIPPSTTTSSTSAPSTQSSSDDPESTEASPETTTCTGYSTAVSCVVLILTIINFFIL